MTILAPLRIGILGAARIAPPALIAPCRNLGIAEVVSVAARDVARAEVFAKEHGIGRVAANYETLIDDPEIDAIYNALPPMRHADLSIRALRAGKAVLCEKPLCMTAEEARAMVAAAQATGGMLMEAFHYRYHPLFARVLEIVRGGELGRLSRLEAEFNVPIAYAPEEIRYDDAIGGGALMDLGTYPVHWCRTVLGEEPAVTEASAELHAMGADLATWAELVFPSGATARIACSMDAGPTIRLTVTGEAGVLRINNPLAPQLGHLVEVEGANPRRETFTKEPTYDFQLRAFVDAVRTGVAPVTSGDDSVAQMNILEQIRRISRART